MSAQVSGTFEEFPHDRVREVGLAPLVDPARFAAHAPLADPARLADPA